MCNSAMYEGAVGLLAYMGSSEHKETLAGGVVLINLRASGSHKQTSFNSFTLRACIWGRMGCASNYIVVYIRCTDHCVYINRCTNI